MKMYKTNFLKILNIFNNLKFKKFKLAILFEMEHTFLLTNNYTYA